MFNTTYPPQPAPATLTDWQAISAELDFESDHPPDSAYPPRASAQGSMPPARPQRSRAIDNLRAIERGVTKTVMHNLSQGLDRLPGPERLGQWRNQAIAQAMTQVTSLTTQAAPPAAADEPFDLDAAIAQWPPANAAHAPSLCKIADGISSRNMGSARWTTLWHRVTDAAQPKMTALAVNLFLPRAEALPLRDRHTLGTQMVATLRACLTDGALADLLVPLAQLAVAATGWESEDRATEAKICRTHMAYPWVTVARLLKWPEIVNPASGADRNRAWLLLQNMIEADSPFNDQGIRMPFLRAKLREAQDRLGWRF